MTNLTSGNPHCNAETLPLFAWAAAQGRRHRRQPMTAAGKHLARHHRLPGHLADLYAEFAGIGSGGER